MIENYGQIYNLENFIILALTNVKQNELITVDLTVLSTCLSNSMSESSEDDKQILGNDKII